MTTSPLIDDLAYLSDQHAGALVTRDGTVVWLCLPRYDSPAVFTSLLGEPEHGQWSLRIADGEVVERAYVPGTLVLRTHWRGPEGEAEVLDLMPLGEEADDDVRADLVRIVRCTAGTVRLEQELRLRNDYGEVVPWVHRGADAHGEPALIAVAGGDGVVFHGGGFAADGAAHRSVQELAAGQAEAASLAWFPSWETPPAAPDAEQARERTEADWLQWLGGPVARGPRAERVERSLLTLRGLTHRETGGIVAAATTSLPEEIGGVRNWDYRYVWLRDTALTLEALIAHEHVEEATLWRDWLLRAVAGDPEELKIMYTLAGERHMPEFELPHLPGYEGSRPVRVGNGAAGQWQADVVGEVMIALETLREAGVEETRGSWALQRRLVDQVLAHWDTPEHGLWEMRGEPAFFTHGRVMMWAALDRAVRAVERHGQDAPAEEVDHWRERREALRAEVLERGVDGTGAFTQTYGSTETDSSLLQIAHTGFVPFDDPHMLATVARIEEDLLSPTGLVHRYRMTGTDGLPGEEAPFVLCSYWLVEQYARSGRTEDAERLMARLDECSSDLHLLAEEYDDEAGRMLGNVPQAFSHLGLIRAADALEDVRGEG